MLFQPLYLDTVIYSPGILQLHALGSNSYLEGHNMKYSALQAKDVFQGVLYSRELNALAYLERGTIVHQPRGYIFMFPVTVT